MKVYFAGSIRGGRTDVGLYHRLIEYLKKEHRVLTEHVGDLSLQEASTDTEIYRQDTAWLRESDLVIAECSNPSLGVGYELAYAEKHGKPVHILYNRGRGSLSAMLTGDPYFHIHPYEREEEICPILDGILKIASESTPEYRFYGWQTADITDRYGLTPRDYYDLLKNIWCADTCAPRMREGWTPENRTLGQCSITAFLLQDIYGGKVYGVPLGDGNFHCFNAVGECVFDLTSEQFEGKKLDYRSCPEQLREVHFKKAEKKQRYELLKERLMKKREETVHL